MSSASDIICLLDDEPCVLKALGRLLASDGLKSEKFSDPLSFLDHVRTHPVRLAVIDLRMPGMTGLEVLKILRKISPLSRVILMTGESDASYRETAMLSGANAFFLKPFEDGKFLKAVRDALGGGWR